MAQVVIASRLSDGLVVFLKQTPSPASPPWVLTLASADVAESDERAALLLRIGEADAAANQAIVDPYLIEVEEHGGRLRPTKFREVIRCLGPTVRPDFGKPVDGPKA